MTLIFTVPMPLNLANSRMHHMVRHKAKVAYWERLDLMVAGEILPARPKVPWPKVCVTSRMTLGAAMDDDNAMARHKWVLDWLVKRKYVVDDKRKCLTWGGIPEQHVSRKNEPSITLTVEPVWEKAPPNVPSPSPKPSTRNASASRSTPVPRTRKTGESAKSAGNP